MSSSKARSVITRRSANLLSEIEAHARRDYPDEACGLILGRRAGIAIELVAAYAARNETEGERAHRYAVGVETYRAAEIEATRRDAEVIGVYHSHPDSPPVPSSVDDEFAFPEWIYWITEVRAGAPVENRLWHRNADLKSWTELGLVEIPD